MTIHAVEQVLDGAIALLVYGSGGWLSCSLVAFVVTRQVVKADEAIAQVACSDAVGSVVLEETVSASQEIVSQEIASIEVMPETMSEGLLEGLPEGLPEIGFVAEVPLMVCQPVNWKKWKVGELRQANITRVCGVRVSPIGSRRKLTKADLIAQYEQNLKRMTYEQPGEQPGEQSGEQAGEQPSLALRSEKTA